jgi:hypothetical protein
MLEKKKLNFQRLGESTTTTTRCGCKVSVRAKQVAEGGDDGFCVVVKHNFHN